MTNPDNIRLQEIANKFLNGKISDAEQAEFDAWFNQIETNDIFVPESVASSEEEHRQIILNRIHEKINQYEKGNRVRRMWLRVAAAVILMMLSFGLFKIFNKQISYQHTLSKLKSVTPGGNNAILTLANGKQIVLNNSRNGLLVNLGNITVSKANNGQVIYKVIGSAKNTLRVSYNTITTPNGGQYEVILPDGSKVWINSSSSLKYPTQFTGKERDVELNGEGYFEVAKNKLMPFKVSSHGQTVEVLGTHFNINAYTDEPGIKTTLLEGSVKVTVIGTEKPQLLIPGQQAIFNKGGIMVSDADTAQAVAWKNGLFYFKDADVASIMRLLARWYNLKIDINGQLPERKFSGKIYKNLNAAQVLQIINYSAINYKVEEPTDGKSAKRLIITP